MRYGGSHGLVVSVAAMMIAIILLFESYVVAHCGLLSDKAFSSASDFLVFLVCPAFPFVILTWLARGRKADRHQDARAQGAFFAGIMIFLFSAYVFFRFVEPIGSGMDQGTGRIFVLLLPIVSGPATLVLFGVGYGVAIAWKRHQDKDGVVGA